MCTSYYELADGVLLAQGRVDFNTFVKRQFQLAVRGGTKEYLGARGVVTVNPASAKATDTRRLAFELLK